ncbi:hypothetical protein [Burkholderia gladioli]|uniref:hypothetical protein n=1 Tax=Burkholderia gladioli TaxID=28095 RepID=UPI001F4939DD|nr:hypothetical protein [Burkholderia gladioli]
MIAQEETKREPDVARATAAEAERKALIAARDALLPDDAPAIAEALALYGRVPAS